MITKLQAVNHLLSTIHEAPVNSLETALPDEASRALTTIDAVSLEVQIRGWKFNTDKNVTLARATPGNTITLPTDVLKAVLNERYRRRGTDFTVRGTQIYDRENRTYALSENVLVDRLVYQLDWEELPTTAQLYIMYKAARVFSANEVSAMESKQNATVEETQAWNELKRDQLDGENPNMFDAPDSALIAGRGVLRAFGF